MCQVCERFNTSLDHKYFFGSSQAKLWEHYTGRHSSFGRDPGITAGRSENDMERATKRVGGSCKPLSSSFSTDCQAKGGGQGKTDEARKKGALGIKRKVDDLYRSRE